MTSKAELGFLDYIQAAFNAKPAWMLLPPNWIGLAAAAALGFANPGIWLLGAGIELAYLHFLGNHPRFRAWVRATHQATQPPSGPGPIELALAHLQPDEREHFLALQHRGRSMLAEMQRQARTPQAIDSQRTAVEQLLWIAMRLLQTRSNLDRYLETITDTGSEAGEIRRQLTRASPSGDLRSSLESRLQLIEQRETATNTMRERRAYVDSELARVGHQIELIGQQALLSSDQAPAAGRLDEVAASVEAANRWLADHQRIYGVVDDLLATPPSLLEEPLSQPPPTLSS